MLTSPPAVVVETVVVVTEKFSLPLPAALSSSVSFHVFLLVDKGVKFEFNAPVPSVPLVLPPAAADVKRTDDRSKLKAGRAAPSPWFTPSPPPDETTPLS